MPVFDVGDWTVYPGARQTGHVWTGFYSIVTRAGIDPEQRFDVRDVKGVFLTEETAMEAARYEGKITAEALPPASGQIETYSDRG